MGLFHRFAHRHGHHHRGHHDHHHERGEGSRAERMAEHAAHHLDLSDAQRGHLSELLELMQSSRESLRGDDPVAELSALIANTRLDREAARAAAEKRVQSVQAGLPGLIEALGNFYDSLDADQQQALRFLLRRKAGWRARFGRRSQ